MVVRFKRKTTVGCYPIIAHPISWTIKHQRVVIDNKKLYNGDTTAAEIGAG